MRAYGECHWYHDEEYQQGNACEIIPDEPTADQMVTPMTDVAEAASDTDSAIEAPAPSAVVGATDCWYDGETDSYYDYEFADTAAAACEDSMTDETPSCGEESYADEACAETGCEQSANGCCEADDVATEEDWDGAESYDYADPGEGSEYPYGGADDAQMAATETAEQGASVEEMAVTETAEPNEDGAWEDDSYSEYEGEYKGEYEEYADSMDEMDASSSVEDQAEAEFTEDSEEVMESTTDVAEITAPSAETPATWPSREYDYKYGGYPYEYESDEPAYVEPTYHEPGYSEPVQAWEDADVEVVEGADDGESVPPAPTSDLVEFDSEVILSLARTLDRVGSTLQSLSQYLTEMATAETAGRHGESLHR
jgi:hypothetical protein